MTISCWVLSPEEIAEIMESGIIWLSVMGDRHPPVFVGSTSALERFTS